MTTRPDWDHIRAFLAVVEAGGVTRAAATTGLSQPTLSRHVAALEAELGVTLFERGPRGLVPTGRAVTLAAEAARMRDAADRFGRLATGYEEAVAGTVRLTASRVVATHVLPPMLAAFRRAEPAVEVELVASDAAENLLAREADIALRMFRPTQGDVVTRLVAELEFGIYATRDYLDRRGRPVSFAEVVDHDLIGYDRDDQLLEGYRAAGVPVTRASFGLRTDDHVAALAAIRAGLGIGLGMAVVCDADPTLERLFHDAPLPVLPVWLTTHVEVRTSARIRRLADHLADAFGRLPRAPRAGPAVGP